MSKKSRKRNKKILGAALAALGGAMLLGRGKGTAFARPKEGTIDQMAADNMPKGIDKVISDVPVKTPTTIQDSMPRVGMKKGDIRPKNPKSIRVLPNTNKVFTIQDAKKGIPPRVGNVKSPFVGDDGLIRQGENATPMTGGRFGTFRAAQEMKKGMLPPQLRAPGRTNLTNTQAETRNSLRNLGNFIFPKANFKDGGKVVKVPGEKVTKSKKKTRIQIQGFGKARR